LCGIPVVNEIVRSLPEQDCIKLLSRAGPMDTTCAQDEK
jgi:hypothetical protein